MGSGGVWRRVLADLQSVITTTGPMSVAAYMKHVLTHPMLGYYVSQKPLDGKGDFVTAPQLSQMFGEMAGAWTVSEWQASGCPSPVHLVELGPGTGILMKDILNSFTKLTGTQRQSVITDVHFVEASPLLSQQQYETMGCGSAPDLSQRDLAQDGEYLQGIGDNGVTFRWYRHLWAMPKLPSFTFLYAHEFFDTMPTHQFQLTEDGWRERMIDVCDESEHKLRFVLAPQETPQSKAYSSMPLVRTARQGDVGELSLEAMEQAGHVARVLTDSELGGRALIFDYGDTTKFDDTFRAFRNHEQVHVFDKPGTADLTTDINFDHLLLAAARSHKVMSHGPIPQREFLLNCGIEHRARALADAVTDEQTRESIDHHVNMLTDEDAMGLRFKVMAMTDPNTTRPPVLFPGHDHHHGRR